MEFKSRSLDMFYSFICFSEFRWINFFSSFIILSERSNNFWKGNASIPLRIINIIPKLFKWEQFLFKLGVPVFASQCMLSSTGISQIIGMDAELMCANFPFLSKDVVVSLISKSVSHFPWGPFLQIVWVVWSWSWSWS